MCQVSIVHQRGAKGKHDKTHFGGGGGGGGGWGGGGSKFKLQCWGVPDVPSWANEMAPLKIKKKLCAYPFTN